MTDGDPIHQELPGLADDDLPSRDLAEEDVADPLTEFVDCGVDPDEDGAPPALTEPANPGVMDCLTCPQVLDRRLLTSNTSLKPDISLKLLSV